MGKARTLSRTPLFRISYLVGKKYIGSHCSYLLGMSLESQMSAQCIRGHGHLGMVTIIRGVLSFEINH